jgi:arsenate reductase
MVTAMQEKGLDMAFRTPQHIESAIADNRPEIIVTMGCGEECPFVPGAQMLDWDLADPAGKSPEFMRSVRDEIENRVKNLIEQLS